MFHKIWYVAQKDLLQLTKDRMGLIWLIALPLIMMSVLGTLTESISNTAGSITATLPVIDQDHGQLSTVLVAALRHTPSLVVKMETDVATTEKAVRNGDEVGLLIIPNGFSSALKATHPAAHVTYYAVSGNNDQRATIASYSVQSVIQQFAWASVTGAAISTAQQQSVGHVDPALTSQLTAQATRQLNQAPPVTIATINATGRKINYQDQTVPGYALMFSLFGITAAAGSILEEKEKGTFKRLLVAPLPPLALLGGKMLALFIQSVLQLSVLFAIGVLLFKIDVGSSITGLALLIVGTSLAATGLGMILVSVIKTQRQLRPITTLVVLGFSAVGGSWFPISLEPQWLQNVSRISINAWAMQGFNGLMIFGKTFTEIAPDILALFVYGAVCFTVSVRIFRFSEA